MTVTGEEFDEKDIEKLGRMHIEALPESLVSRVGLRFAKSFYRYIVRSTNEVLFVERDRTDTNILLGACIVSLRPKELNRRLLWNTPLLPLSLPRLPRLLRNVRSSAKSKDTGIKQSEGPEIILIFVQSNIRSHGCGSRLLIDAEEWLTKNGYKSVFVKTSNDEDNHAIRFYLRFGFNSLGTVISKGKKLILFQKGMGSIRTSTYVD